MIEIETRLAFSVSSASFVPFGFSLYQMSTLDICIYGTYILYFGHFMEIKVTYIVQPV